MVLLGILARVWKVLSEAMIGKMETVDDGEDSTDEQMVGEAGKVDKHGLAVVGNASGSSKHELHQTESSTWDNYRAIEGDDLGEPVRRSDVVRQLGSVDVSAAQIVRNNIVLPKPLVTNDDHDNSDLASVAIDRSQSTSSKQHDKGVETLVRRKKHENQTADSKHLVKRRKKKANAIDDLFGDL